jgi:hypothetical protein
VSGSEKHLIKCKTKAKYTFFLFSHAYRIFSPRAFLPNGSHKETRAALSNRKTKKRKNKLVFARTEISDSKMYKPKKYPKIGDFGTCCRVYKRIKEPK